MAGFLDSSSYSNGGVDRMAVVFIYVYMFVCLWMVMRGIRRKMKEGVGNTGEQI